MSPAEPLRIGYVVKRFPRYSETFIVTEILAHEAAGWPIEIFALRACTDTHFQPELARLRAGVRYLPEGVRGADLWLACNEAAKVIPDVWQKLAYARAEDVKDVIQALVLAREIRTRRLDHLHAHFASGSATVARLAAHLAGIPYTFTAHAKDIFIDGLNAKALQRNLRDAATTITVSDFNKSYLQSQFGAAAARVERIYNGIDLARFAFRPDGQREALIVAVGRLVEKKGFDDLIDACAHLARGGRSFRCEILGEGELESSLQSQITARGLERYVTLVGPRSSEAVVESVGRAAAFAAPCIMAGDGNRDGLPTTVLEAMAIGTPVITTDVTGIPEAVTDRVNGLVVPQRDPARLADAIAQMLDDRTLAATLAEEARRVVERRFDSRVNAAALREAWTAVHVPSMGAA